MLVGEKVFPFQSRDNCIAWRPHVLLGCAKALSTLLIVVSLMVSPPDTERSYPMTTIQGVSLTALLTLVHVSPPATPTAAVVLPMWCTVAKGGFIVLLIHMYTWCVVAGRGIPWAWVVSIMLLLLCLLAIWTYYFPLQSDAWSTFGIWSSGSVHSESILVLVLIAVLVGGSVTVYTISTWPANRMQLLQDDDAEGNPLLSSIGLASAHRQRDFYTLRSSVNSDPGQWALYRFFTSAVSYAAR